MHSINTYHAFDTVLFLLIPFYPGPTLPFCGSVWSISLYDSFSNLPNNSDPTVRRVVCRGTCETLKRPNNRLITHRNGFASWYTLPACALHPCADVRECKATLQKAFQDWSERSWVIFGTDGRIIKTKIKMLKTKNIKINKITVIQKT